jgi:pyrrolidone-carboxylate peptidase
MTQQVEIHLTGFGSFSGVSDNPSQMLVEYYKEHLNEHGLASATVLEVSTHAANEYLDSIKQKIVQSYDKEARKKIVLLHLGVSAASKRYEIECRGKNEATFRAADERQFRPFKELIDINNSLDSWRYTSLPVDILTTHVNQTLSTTGLHKPLSTFAPVRYIEATKNPLPLDSNGTETVETVAEDTSNVQEYGYLSKDAGLFLCNYIYYRSLQVSQELQDSGISIDSLFVHIPSHKTIPIEQQRLFVDALLETIQNKLT